MTDNIATLLTDQVYNQSLIPSTDIIQLTLTLKLTTAQVVQRSVTVNNSPIPSIQDYDHPDDQPTYEVTPGFKPSKTLIDDQILPNLEVACVEPPPPLWKKSEKRLLLRLFLKGSGGGGGLYTG